MKIVIMVYAEPKVGLGHWYRSIELAKRAEERGHYVTVVGNKMARPFTFFQIREGETMDLYHVLHQTNPDYLVVDLQDRVPDYIYDLVKSRLVVLNGVGREEEQKADLTVIQGFANGLHPDNIYAGPEYVILRRELFQIKEKFKPGPDVPKRNWFVWGGANDKMNLLPTFPQVFPEQNSFLIINKHFPLPAWTKGGTIHWNPAIHSPTLIDDLYIVQAMLSAKKACIAMGMVAWELAALGVPTYAFSWSEGHLKFAQRMQEHGLIKAYPRVGLPSPEEMQAFLSEPFEPDVTNAPDDKGADRILDLMEKDRHG